MTQEIDLTLKSERATLELLLSDLSQIYAAGKAACQEGKEAEQFLAMYESAQSLRGEFNSQFSQSMDLVIRADRETLFPTKEDLKKRSEFTAKYYKIVEFYNRCKPRQAYSESRSNETILNTATLNTTMSSQARLPKIDLPQFSGSITEWTKYKQLYISLIHSNTEIPDIQRFHYLSSTLKGEALNVISAFTLTEDNYPKAWDALCKRYDNPRLLAATYVERVLEYAPPSGQPTLASLQRFIASVAENINAFKSINVPNETDFMWLSLALRKLDPETRKHFEISCVSTEWPTFAQLEAFVRGRCKILQLANPSANITDLPICSKPSRSQHKGSVLTTTSSTNSKACSCSKPHPLYECPVYRGKSVSGRKAYLKCRNICFNCLKVGHFLKLCSSNGRCKVCGGKHHTSLHVNEVKEAFSRHQQNGEQGRALQTDKNVPNDSSSDNEPASVCASVTATPTQVLLGTALVLVVDAYGTPKTARALIDSGSHFSLITTRCAQRLCLSWKASNHRPFGAGETPLPKVKGKLRCTIISRINSDCHLEAEPLVVSTITGKLPPNTLESPNIHHIQNLELADPNFWEPNSIDLLLGADLFIKILKGAPISLGDSYQALPTSLGLVVMGNTKTNITRSQPLHCHCIYDSSISEDVFTKFWEVEDVIPEPFQKPTDPCEEEFVQNHYRDTSGRYVVSLPFKDDPSHLEESKNVALRRLKTLEAKMEKTPVLKEKYQAFMKEYETLGHMSLTSSRSAYVIPHHAVFKHNDSTGKIRVVFDASASTSNGSLNDKLHVGPNLQSDISHIIMNFRRYPIAVTADMVKMYRQILIRPEDRKYQHILWRASPTDPVQTYQLNTVTYGTKPAMFLAKRSIVQLVRDEGAPYPLASRALMQESYVDDIVSGAHTEEEALKLKDELISLLERGKFEIHKWSSNSQHFLSSLSPNEGSHDLDLSPKDAPATKILGMAWDPERDQFYYDVNLEGYSVTKRGILSVIARLYDPMGFLSPTIFKAKTIFQATWKDVDNGVRINWNQKPSFPLIQEWLHFVTALHRLNDIRIPRHIFPSNSLKTQIIGFADASEKGYAAALYLRALTKHQDVKVSLLKAKTRLAPLKTISIPKLELCGAHLLVKTLTSIKTFIDASSINEVLLYTDSTVVLSWINLSPHQLQTFVANRISYILTHTKPIQWHHVSSGDNPADIASRGLGPTHLRSASSWWAGPSWLHNPDWSPLPSQPKQEGDIPELKSGITLHVTVENPDMLTWIARHSEFKGMIRSLAYVLRFISNLKSQNNRRYGPLSVEEINDAITKCVRISQHHDFQGEFSWSEGKPLSKRLIILNAFTDDQGILRVGGRLLNAGISEDSKHPMILTGSCHLTKLLIDYFHKIHFHLGQRALQSLIIRKYWIFRLRQTIKSRISKCLVCFKMKARAQHPIMGQLPSCRVTPSRPFSNTGVDYAGPFHIKLTTRRNGPVSKAYLCVFICLSSRAVHLEVVTSLTTDAFMASLDRFVARRGKPHSIRSDCGTNFVGAARRLKDLYTWLRNKKVQEELSAHLAIQEIQWLFNPPHSPHFGGIWEAAVKSAKQHLYRVTGDRAFHFEELVTLFTRIEAVLNSRPICALQDPDAGDVLTPGHFLIGAPLVSIPERDLTTTNINHLSRWQLISNSVQHFWKRWHAEYIQSLQKRAKWYHSTKDINKGDLVLIADPSSPPLRWKTARVEDCHPGIDGVVRVVSIRDSRGLKKFPVHSLVSLSNICQSHPDNEF